MLFTFKDIETLQEILYPHQRSIEYIRGTIQKSWNIYQQRNSFFKTYKESSIMLSDEMNDDNILMDILAIIRSPVLFSIGAVVCAFNTVVATCYLIGALIATLGTAICYNIASCNEPLKEAAHALLNIGINLAGTAAAVLLVCLSVPHNIALVLTRTAFTAAEAIEEYRTENLFAGAPQ